MWQISYTVITNSKLILIAPIFLHLVLRVQRVYYTNIAYIGVQWKHQGLLLLQEEMPLS